MCAAGVLLPQSTQHSTRCCVAPGVGGYRQDTGAKDTDAAVARIVSKDDDGERKHVRMSIERDDSNDSS